VSPFLPVEDPSDRGSLADRTLAYVRENPVLRITLVLTMVDHAGALVLLALGLLTPQSTGLLVLLNVLGWFFAVALPVMNREVRVRMGAEPVGYWGEVVEIFARVVLCALTGLYSAALLLAVFS
jgi:hypothetical protein